MSFQGRRRTRPFLRGPVDWPSSVVAMALPGRAFAVWIALWQLAGLTGTRRVKLGYRRLPFTRWTVARGLATLEEAGLVLVERRRGRMPVVTLPPDILRMVKR